MNLFLSVLFWIVSYMMQTVQWNIFLHINEGKTIIAIVLHYLAAWLVCVSLLILKYKGKNLYRHISSENENFVNASSDSQLILVSFSRRVFQFYELY